MSVAILCQVLEDARNISSCSSGKIHGPLATNPSYRESIQTYTYYECPIVSISVCIHMCRFCQQFLLAMDLPILNYPLVN
jgi:hypothetical protein